ncbi:arginase family protein [Dactylosporangium vinaceum]|uniref:Arginase family protein n=1 Tax=Dactylosporangium vinaceum TaxID=53362 RepID=A0ABV5M9V7_9ACTN|nr:arginase family protein [Dactylosporangium vinaceum]UAB99987.1 arginase family protein [Dactylosporangium vinaceum]
MVIEVICAPWSVGLRPGPGGTEPGAWQAPGALVDAGLAERLGAVDVTRLPHPPYSVEPTSGTRIQNGLTVREHALRLADTVAGALTAGHRPLVLGGDCSILLGCLAGARRQHHVGLIHVDGHTDFAHSGDQNPTELGTAAGMGLALATGRGELLLTHWPDTGTPLVTDDEVVQVGDRTGRPAPMRVIGIEELLASGIDATARTVLKHLAGAPRLWLHLDLDVLDGTVLPAVDSPGSPGLTFAQLTDLLTALWRTGRIAGLDVTIYDPGQAHLPAIADCLVEGLT